MTRYSAIFFCLGCLIFAPASATSVVDKSLPELIAASDHIVIARITDVAMFDRDGRRIVDPDAQTGPGAGLQLRITISIANGGLLKNEKGKLTRKLTYPLWDGLIMSLKEIRSEIGQSYIILLKSAPLGETHPGYSRLPLSQIEEVRELIQKKRT